MSKAQSYVQCDDQGVMRVGHTRVMLDSIVAGFEQGHSLETIQQQYPALSLEEVYGAIAYYLANTDESPLISSVKTINGNHVVLRA